MSVGVVALARPTFDVEHAETVAADAFNALDKALPGWEGPRKLLFDAPATRAAMESLAAAGLSALVVMQVTFTDATMTKELARAIDAPFLLWAFPEERTGGRLRLNSLCGVNLAAYVLKRQGKQYSYVYRRPDDPGLATTLSGLADRPPTTAPSPAPPARVVLGDAAYSAADRVVAALRGATTGVIGTHPDGFDPCAYDAATVEALTGARVEQVELGELFTAAEGASVDSVEAARTRASTALGSLDHLEQPALDNSLRLYCGLSQLAAGRDWAGFATRCWPECFTEFGAAACAPQAMMTEDGTPGGCEADAYGTLTSLILQELADEPPFVADLVDVDVADDTAVFWHCGVAPLHMADPARKPGPTVHSNRRKPLLHEFALKPGRVTIGRLSQAGGTHTLVVLGGEVLPAPLPFSGTAGVIRFDRPASDVLATIMASGLEHHYGIVYGDFRQELRALAERWEIPIIDIA